MVSGPVFLSRGGRLVLWTNLATHPPMRNTRQRPYLLRITSNPSTSWWVASLNISGTVFASAGISAVAVVVMSTGQALGCESHFGPCHQRSSSCATGPPRLPRSAGFSLVGTYLHFIQFLSRILRTRLCTNCLYSLSLLFPVKRNCTV